MRDKEDHVAAVAFMKVWTLVHHMATNSIICLFCFLCFAFSVCVQTQSQEYCSTRYGASECECIVPFLFECWLSTSVFSPNDSMCDFVMEAYQNRLSRV
jgi:hypothetical protein